MKNHCYPIKVTTPKKHILYSLWFGPKIPKSVIIFIHGLSGNVYSNHKLIIPTVSHNTAVVTFNNRGHDTVSKLYKVDKRKKKGYSSSPAGAAHEIFTDCVDDIQGVVNFAKGKGVNNIYLAGQSTGCQKIIYYLSQRGKQKLIKGVILLAPMSDYAAILKMVDNESLNKAVNYAKKLIKDKEGHEILPKEVWEWQSDAQRFISLYTPNSEEEIFCYATKNKNPGSLQKVKIPMLVVYAEKDIYRDRPINKIAQWFEKNSKSKNLTIQVVRGSPHSFNSYEDQVINHIKSWLRSH